MNCTGLRARVARLSFMSNDHPHLHPFIHQMPAMRENHTEEAVVGVLPRRSTRAGRVKGCFSEEGEESQRLWGHGSTKQDGEQASSSRDGF